MLPKLHIHWERWKYNKTFEVYVSNMGHIRNSSKAPLAPKINKCGYCVVRIGGSDPKWITVHRLVMLTWRPTPEAEILTVDHLDHNRRNNALSNLEWVTFEENQNRAARDLTYDSQETPMKPQDIPAYVQVTDKETGEIHKVTFEKVGSLANYYSDYLKHMKRPTFNKDAFVKIVHDILTKKNCVGFRKWAGLIFEAKYKKG